MLAPALAAGGVPGLVDMAAIGITVGLDLYFQGAFGTPVATMALRRPRNG
jgi:uncharacterized membrane protein YhiD involved in acid resistance